MKHILLVEDDSSLAFLIQDNLENAGYLVTYKIDGVSALKSIENQYFDAILLDVNLPKLDGFSVAKSIRTQNLKTPILFLTARDQTEDRLNGFRLGGDDYITKPFSIEELLLRLEVFLRRSADNNNTPKNNENGQFEFNYANLWLRVIDKTHKLTQKEADVLFMLLNHKNEIVKREDILIKAWGKNDYFLGRSLDVFISRLRKHLNELPGMEIETIHGIGFRLNYLKS